jgi:hypothetical protein
MLIKRFIAIFFALFFLLNNCKAQTETNCIIYKLIIDTIQKNTNKLSVAKAMLGLDKKWVKLIITDLGLSKSKRKYINRGSFEQIDSIQCFELVSKMKGSGDVSSLDRNSTVFLSNIFYSKKKDEAILFVRSFNYNNDSGFIIFFMSFSEYHWRISKFNFIPDR